MPPKTPSELKEQAKRENAKPHSDDRDMTAEGMAVPRPARKDFFANLKKISEPSEDSEGAEAPTDAR
jgi:hypothetical protein